MTDNLFWLNEGQPPPSDKVRGVPRVDDRRVISGIVHIMRSGCRWMEAPDAYGPRKTFHNLRLRWAEKGHWVRIFEALADVGGPPAQVLIDGSAVCTHRLASSG